MKNKHPTKETLKPCINPRCEEEVGLYKEKEQYIILCKFCELYLAHPNKNTLIQAWNTRPKSPLVGLDRNKLKKIIRYQMEARGASINPKDDFEGFVYDIEQAICAKFGSPQKESFHSCHFIPCPICEKNKPDPRFVEVKKIEWPKEQSSGKFSSGKLIESDYEQGWNDALDVCKTAVEKAKGLQ